MWCLVIGTLDSTIKVVHGYCNMHFYHVYCSKKRKQLKEELFHCFSVLPWFKHLDRGIMCAWKRYYTTSKVDTIHMDPALFDQPHQFNPCKWQVSSIYNLHRLIAQLHAWELLLLFFSSFLKPRFKKNVRKNGKWLLSTFILAIKKTFTE